MDRFWSKVEQHGPDECWPWLGARDADGYGFIKVGGRMRRASHVSWEIANGQPFPAGMQAHHSCDNPPCVNPGHLWPGTQLQNVHDAIAKGRRAPTPRRTHCKRGHELVEENIRVNTNGHRQCLTCKRAVNVIYKRGKRAQKI